MTAGASPSPSSDGASHALPESVPTEPHPAWIAPMLATLTDRPFSDADWLFEPKFDGYRCLAFRDGPEVRLLSRNRLDLRGSYPRIEAQLLAEPAQDFVIDGEIVAMDGDRPSFGLLQRSGGSQVPVFFFVFDVLHLEGCSTRSLPLRARKEVLERAFMFGDNVRRAPYRASDGAGLYEEMCRRGWEGVIAKRADSTYVSRRSRDWLKFKCVRRQELVVGGFTEPQHSRFGFGALLVGYHDADGVLVYAGKVGTGFSDELLADLRRRLDRLERATSPFGAGAPPTKGVHWVRPTLVAEVAFGEWTDDGKLRHPRFVGLRTDKAAADVVREYETQPE